jgi:hypothetical protein
VAKTPKGASGPKGPKVVVGEGYEEAGIEFLQVMAVELDIALKDSGVADVKTRRKVVDTFCFGMGNFLDQYWFEAAGKKQYAVVCFADKHREDGPETFGLPEIFDYHEYATGVFDAATNKGKGPYKIRIGLVGEDEPVSPEELEE